MKTNTSTPSHIPFLCLGLPLFPVLPRCLLISTVCASMLELVVNVCCQLTNILYVIDASKSPKTVMLQCCQSKTLIV